jgi:hypothetical protein
VQSIFILKKETKKKDEGHFCPFLNMLYVYNIYAHTQYIQIYTWGVNENSSKDTKYTKRERESP